MQSEIESAREHAAAALKHVDPACPPGSNFQGKRGDALVFTCATCKREVEVSNLSPTGSAADVAVPSLKVHVGRIELRDSDPDRFFVAMTEGIMLARRRAELDALDALAATRLTAAGCLHQATISVDDAYHVMLEHDAGRYRLYCPLNGCGAVVHVTIDEAIAIAPIIMAHHVTDRAELAQTAAAESLLTDNGERVELEASEGGPGPRPTLAAAIEAIPEVPEVERPAPTTEDERIARYCELVDGGMADDVARAAVWPVAIITDEYVGEGPNLGDAVLAATDHVK